MKINNRNLSDNETTQDVPMILNPELRDVFRIFVSMLDIKSFMKLAMTSKDMQKRCMEDKSIRINVNEDFVYGYEIDKFLFNSSVASEKFTDSYLYTLTEMRCTINLRAFEIRCYQTTSSMTDSARQYLAKIGVKRIEKLSLSSKLSDLNAVASFVRDFHVDVLALRDVRASLPVLRSLLQLNLKEFSCDDRFVPVDILFEIYSPIPKISFHGMENIPKEQFMQILWMIQSGSLTHLTFSNRAVDWSTYDKLPFDHEAAIPEDRPLLFKRTENNQFREYWFLHWQGGVTKCVVRSRALEVFKCKPRDLPVALRKEEDVIKDLTEMHSGVSCLLKHFRTFSESLAMLNPSLKGPLPTERPLYFKASEDSLWRLDEDDNLMECLWDSGCITWKPCMPIRRLPFAHRSLAKYLFWKLLKEKAKSSFNLYCETQEEFDSWFEDYKTLDYDYTGPLPDDRPLVFDGEDPTIRIVLLDDASFHCSFTNNEVYVEQYNTWQYRNDEAIETLLENSSSFWHNACVNVRVSLKTFRDGLKLFESDKHGYGPFVGRSMKQISGVLTEECWYIFHGAITKVVWSEGRLVKTPGLLRECPIEIMKMLFVEFATQGQCPITISLKLGEFDSCLEQFTVVPFDHTGPLRIHFPLAFVEKEIRHTCNDDKHNCQCTDVIIRVRFLWNYMISTHCSWGEEEPEKIVFKILRNRRDNMPAALKSKEYLKTLLEIYYDIGTQYEWFGDMDNFLAFFNDFKKFPFGYKGDLPTERPLVFEDDSNDKEPVLFILRADNRIVKCKWTEVSKRIGGVACLSRPRSERVNPPATWELFKSSLV